MVSRQERRVLRHNAELNAKMQAEMQEVGSETNKLRIGMTINDVQPLEHGMDIKARADDAWLSVLPDNKRFLYSADWLWLRQQDDGTFTFLCICRTEPLSRNEKLTAPQAGELMKQKMSRGYEWHGTFTFDKWPSLEASFTVTFGPDGRVKDITDVSTGDLSSDHRA